MCLMSVLKKKKKNGVTKNLQHFLDCRNNIVTLGNTLFCEIKTITE